MSIKTKPTKKKVSKVKHVNKVSSLPKELIAELKKIANEELHMSDFALKNGLYVNQAVEYMGNVHKVARFDLANGEPVVIIKGYDILGNSSQVAISDASHIKKYKSRIKFNV